MGQRCSGVVGAKGGKVGDGQGVVSTKPPSPSPTLIVIVVVIVIVTRRGTPAATSVVPTPTTLTTLPVLVRGHLPLVTVRAVVCAGARAGARGTDAYLNGRCYGGTTGGTARGVAMVNASSLSEVKVSACGKISVRVMNGSDMLSKAGATELMVAGQGIWVTQRVEANGAKRGLLPLSLLFLLLTLLPLTLLLLAVLLLTPLTLTAVLTLIAVLTLTELPRLTPNLLIPTLLTLILLES